MDRLDSQRYDISKRFSPTCEENGVADAGNTGSKIPAVQGASSIESPLSSLLSTSTPLKPIPLFNTPQCVALNVPLPLSPLPSSKFPSLNGFMEDAFTLPDVLDKDPLIKFTLTLSSEGDSKSSQNPESTAPRLMSPSPRVSSLTIRPTQPLFHEDSDSEGIFSPPVSPTLAALPLNPHPSPMSPHSWKSASPRPLSPLYYPADGSALDRFETMSCPTSPLLRVGSPSPFPYPTSPSACHAMFSSVSRRLRALSPSPSLSRATSPVPSSPLSRPTSPVLQAFNVEHWAPERDPTEGIDVIEILVTKEISVCIEESD
ncbi:hypothetical protein BJV78DRAFT_1283520 [Lactifluus subvellereus]|nr:hypothetical protein BJV78DRAFT_1283520 [Lactifluus subvellereus]